MPIAVLQSEASYASNQGIVNVALWPSKAFITLALKSAGFTHIYQPVTAPNHPEFRPGEANIHRAIFIASFEPLENSKLDEAM